MKFSINGEMQLPMGVSVAVPFFGGYVGERLIRGSDWQTTFILGTASFVGISSKLASLAAPRLGALHPLARTPTRAQRLSQPQARPGKFGGTLQRIDARSNDGQRIAALVRNFRQFAERYGYAVSADGQSAFVPDAHALQGVVAHMKRSGQAAPMSLVEIDRDFSPASYSAMRRLLFPVSSPESEHFIHDALHAIGALALPQPMVVQIQQYLVIADEICESIAKLTSKGTQTMEGASVESHFMNTFAVKMDSGTQLLSDALTLPTGNLAVSYELFVRGLRLLDEAGTSLQVAALHVTENLPQATRKAIADILEKTPRGLSEDELDLVASNALREMKGKSSW